MSRAVKLLVWHGSRSLMLPYAWI